MLLVQEPHPCTLNGKNVGNFVLSWYRDFRGHSGNVFERRELQEDEPIEGCVQKEEEVTERMVIE